jgi:hypothetical protein
MSDSQRAIRVTAQERAHPALRKLARAAIQLARLQLGKPVSATSAEEVQPTRPESAHD